MWLACILLLGQEVISQKHFPHQFKNCLEVSAAASQDGLNPHLIAAIAYSESRFFRRRTSNKGAQGILQVIPKYWCERRRNCDYQAAGLRAWKTYRAMSKTDRDALCRYSSGRTCAKSRAARRYARKVLRNYYLIKL